MITALAFAFMLYFLWKLGQANVCIACGGRGMHRDGCSFKR